MKLVPMCCLLGSLLFATMAHAASDHANGQHGAQSNAGGNTSGGGNGAGQGKSDGRGSGKGNAGSRGVESDQNGALKAVTDKKALPLEKLLKIVEQSGFGRVIDVKLVSIKGQLVYLIVFLNDIGVSRRAYYAADTGKPFRLQ